MYACSPEWKGEWISEHDLEVCLKLLRGHSFINYQIIGPTVSICIAHQSLSIYYEALLKAI